MMAFFKGPVRWPRGARAGFRPTRTTSHVLALSRVAETVVGGLGFPVVQQTLVPQLFSVTEWWTFLLCDRQHDSPVKSECLDAHLLHERIPPSCLLEVLHS